MAKDFKLFMIKQVIKNYSLYERFKREFLTNMQKLARILKFDMTKISPSDTNKFTFRNFSSYLRKPGASYNGLASVVLIVIIMYVLIVFPAMNSEKTKFASFVVDNKVTSFTVINFAIYLTFFILHYYIEQMKSIDIKGLVSKEYVQTLISEFDTQVFKDMKPSVIEKFKRAATKAKNILIFTGASKKSKAKTDYRTNPLFYLFLFSMFLWIYVNVSTFLWHSYHGNFKSANKPGFSKFICEPNDKQGDLVDMNKIACKNYLENPYS